MKRTVVFSMEDMPGWGFKKILGGSHNCGATNFFQSHIGNGVDVYLLDSGIVSEHSEFSFLKKTNRIETLADLIDQSENGKDRCGHGTGIASIIGGLFVGVAPEVNFFNLRISRDFDTFPETVIKGLDIALQHYKSKSERRPSLVNLSFVTKRNSELDQKVLEMIDAGMIVICAAGDQGEPIENFSPAGLEQVITVGGFDKDLHASSGFFKPKNTIIKNNFGQGVDILAPSQLVNVAAINNYTAVSGSSVACAYVTGVAACFLEQSPSLRQAELKARLIENSRSGLIMSPEHCNGHLPDRILFNPLQLLKPRWDRTQSLLGVIPWGGKVDVSFNCSSRIGEDLKFELVNGDLPEGLVFNGNGKLSGQINQPAVLTDDPEYFNLLVKASDSSGSTERLLYLIAAKPDKIESLKISQGLVRLSNMPKTPCDRWCNTSPGGHQCCCVTGETLIETPNGKTQISQLEIGSELIDSAGAEVHVLDFIEVRLGHRKLYSINGGEAFFTSEHPFVGPEGEFAIDASVAEAIARRPINQLCEGVVLYSGVEGKTFKVETIAEVALDYDIPVYNVIVSGSGQYVANGIAISGKFVVGTASMPMSKQIKNIVSIK